VEVGQVRDCRNWKRVEHVSLKDDIQLASYVQMGDGEAEDNRVKGWQQVTLNRLELPKKI
jgi:hypothetical protein